ncbi:COG4223 family protein [Pseudoruegeria sp. SHC-113]|uniref:COG4223 family protein n=1 Tax=Pseudoruegeria sp. SHC-113 TaxID=2855439 RepID=UPI0021BAADF6|nr:mitofilin family membrane protein [Pseudoruegeria sp. SHC-113]MCT8158618.1 hypothetical protein [Pseudoruegeria sp. SHC-113]
MASRKSKQGKDTSAKPEDVAEAEALLSPESDASDAPEVDEAEAILPEEIEPEDPDDLDDAFDDGVQLGASEEDLRDMQALDGVSDEDLDAVLAEIEEPMEEAMEEPYAPAPAPEQKSGGGLLPVMLGGVVAAGVGFGAAWYLMPRTGGDTEALQAALAAQGETIAALREEIAEMSAASATAPQANAEVAEAIAALQAQLSEQLSGQISGDIAGQIAEVAAQVGAVSAGLSSVDARLLEAEKRPVTESAGAAAAVEAYQRELEALRTTVQEQKTAMEAMSSEAQAEAEARMQEAAERAEAAQAQAAAALTRAALVELLRALESGAPFAEAIASLSENATQPVPEALAAAAEGGVRPMPELQSGFPASARAVLDATIRAENAETITGRLTAFLRNQTGARSLAPREGSDPDAILSRAEAALNANDLAAALAELEQLPEAGQAAMADWLSAARQRATTVKAAQEFAQGLDAI